MRRHSLRAVILALVAGEALRLLVLALVGATPFTIASFARAVSVAAAAGAIAGAALALGRSASPARRVALALAAAVAERTLTTALLLRGGASLDALAPLDLALATALSAGGTWALVALGGTGSLAGFALFALSRCDVSVVPDRYFVVDLLGALETFQVLRRARLGPGHR